MTGHDELDELEDQLKTFRHEPAEGVRRSVLAAHRARYGGRSTPLWRLRVPLYAVAALLAVAVGVTWAASRPDPSDSRLSTHARPARTDTTLVWATAERDRI